MQEALNEHGPLASSAILEKIPVVNMSKRGSPAPWGT